MKRLIAALLICTIRSRCNATTAPAWCSQASSSEKAYFNYKCSFEYVEYIERNESFEIVTDHAEPYADASVECVSTTYASFYYVPMEILQQFPNLKIFDLFGAQLKELDRPFTNCSKLTAINLSSNELKSVSSVFDECTQLEEIDFTGNTIKSIDRITFRNLRNLKQVILYSNYLESIPDDLFDNNEKLEVIEIHLNELTQLPNISFRKFSLLRDLYFGNNPFTAPLDLSNYFNNISTLQWLDMENANILKIGYGSFDGLFELEGLYLHHNQIANLHPKCFEHLQKLKLLALGNNQIVDIGLETFTGLIEVETIELMFNRIESIADGAFVGLTNLKSLDISSNKLSVLKISSFEELPALTKFYMSNNPVEGISSLFFHNFPKLQTLMALDASCIDISTSSYRLSVLRDFDRCFVHVLDCTFKESSYGNACEIRNFDLKLRDEIVMIDGNNALKNVKHLFATDSTLDFIPQIIFNEFRNLSRLELDKVGLRDIRKLHNCTSLTTLSLEHNDVRDLSGGIFENCINLKELFLNGNRIFWNFEDLLKNLKQLRTLHLEDADIELPGMEFYEVEAFSYDFFQDNRLLEELHWSICFPLEIGYLETWINTPNMHTLKMENNKYKNITKYDFRHLEQLEWLSFANNEIEIIEEKSFEPIAALKFLDLSHNKLSSFLPDLFLPSIALDTLQISFNNFDDVPKAFAQLRNLSQLNMASNLLATLSSTLEIPSLKLLNLRNNKIKSISYEALNTTQNLSTLELSGNVCSRQNFYNISELKPQVYPQLRDCFNNFEPCTFTESKFGYSCKLIMGPGSSGGSIRKHLEGHLDQDVKYLQLKFMPMEVDVNLILERFNSLEKVELWRNSMDQLSLLRNCSNLISFDLRQNNISELASRAFSDCSKVEKIVLAKNEIEEVSEKAFESLANLQVLDLSFNQLETFPGGSLNPMKKLKVLKLSHNKLETLLWINDLESLRILDLSFNNILLVNFEALSNHKILRELHLNDNEIAEIYPSVSKVLPNLIYLNLANNRFNKLHLGFQPFDKLQYLDVSNNSIKSIDFNFTSHNHLTHFFATNNVCIDESFQGDELNDILQKFQNC